ncbi:MULTISPECIES: hypothetical protein [Clostridium]|uniref:Spo0E like sporulation regulatory protein n=1 Tax=Clostridium carnis TaxID=1530 RepID=A0ABY6ST79_9CLOT|nr:hypothetical protein [Clostridium carnis]CAI3662169.1 conserved hypothetical protein [Clostridium neonatale]CAI3662725.1 conserved hypothetical protein [Clostridium neonatale]CAI3682992.1 conserved hypothetical protein [Clostridium neonatale]CAI3694413.1 conserved hypothetical protein [Clostridium neonatale]CAI3706881.1 conserved hypothetical protein [Clostridium neonatale]
MNILTETKRKLQFYNDRLKELQDCLGAEYLTKDGVHYLNDELTKAKRNIEYYSEILKKLED